MVCQFCSQENAPDAVYCEHCGTKLTRAERKAQPTQFARYQPGQKPAQVDAPSPNAAPRVRTRLDVPPIPVEEMEEPTVRIPVVRPQVQKPALTEDEGEATLKRPLYSPRKPVTKSDGVASPGARRVVEPEIPSVTSKNDAEEIPTATGAKAMAAAFAARFLQKNSAKPATDTASKEQRDDEEDEPTDEKTPSYMRRPAAPSYVRRDLGADDDYDDDDYDDDSDDDESDDAPPPKTKRMSKSARRARSSAITLSVGGALLLIVLGWLFFTGSGQDVRDVFTGTVRPEKMWAAGDTAFSAGNYAEAIAQYEVALKEQPDNYAGCLKLGQALAKDGNLSRAELAFRRCIAIQPKAVEPYIQLAEILKEQNRDAELFEILDQGRASTGDARLLELYNTLDMPAPRVNVAGGTHVSPLTITLKTDNSAQIYYTLNDTKPSTRSFLYSAPIQLNEGIYTLRAVSVLNGVTSPELVDTYTVSSASGEIPTGSVSTLAFSANPGRYASDDGQKTKTIQIYIPDGSTAYYTTNGNNPTTKSTKYKDGIKLSVGTTTVKAMAVNAQGNSSNVISAEYTILDASQKMFNSSDQFNSFKLMVTTRAASMKQFGSLKNDEDLGNGKTKQTASWGWVEYLNVDGTDVVTDVYVDSSNLTCVRNTKVGQSYSQIVGSFYGELNSSQGDRLTLYSKDDSGSYGWVVLSGGKPIEVHFQVNVSETQFHELIYGIKDDKCVSVELAIRDM